MFLLYLGPIIVAAHFLKPVPAITISTFALIVWTVAYLYTYGSLSLHITAWNILVRVLLFYATTFYTLFLVTKLREEKLARREIERLQRRANPLSGIHLSCDQCGNINTSDNRWVSPLDFLRTIAHAEIHTCICPSCVDKIKSPGQE
jgi:membrane protein implicated in regulation of membrane protease activity